MQLKRNNFLTLFLLLLLVFTFCCIICSSSTSSASSDGDDGNQDAGDFEQEGSDDYDFNDQHASNREKLEEEEQLLRQQTNGGGTTKTQEELKIKNAQLEQALEEEVAEHKKRLLQAQEEAERLKEERENKLREQEDAARTQQLKEKRAKEEKEEAKKKKQEQQEEDGAIGKEEGNKKEEDNQQDASISTKQENTAAIEEEQEYTDSSIEAEMLASESFLIKKQRDAEPLMLLWYAPFLGFGGYKAEALEFVSGILRNTLEPFSRGAEGKPNVTQWRRNFFRQWHNLSKFNPNDPGALEELEAREFDPNNIATNNNNKNGDDNTTSAVSSSSSSSSTTTKKKYEVRMLACQHHGDGISSTADYHNEEFTACHTMAKQLALTHPALPQRWTVTQPHPSRMIVVCHSNQGMWAFPRPDYPTVICPPSAHPVRAYVGRTMFESDRVPLGWKTRLMQMDEIWVPTEFHKKAFSRNEDWPAGSIPESKLRVIPEPIDTELWRRDDIEFAQNYAIPAQDVELWRIPTAARMTRNRLLGLTQLSGIDVEPVLDEDDDCGPSIYVVPGEKSSDPEDDDDADERHRPQIGSRDRVLRSLASYKLWTKDVAARERGGLCLNSRVFISTFKRERRKGWDVLVRSFIESFGSVPTTPKTIRPPCLILHTTDYAENFPLDFTGTLDLFTQLLYHEEEDDEDIINITRQEELMQEEIQMAHHMNGMKQQRDFMFKQQKAALEGGGDSSNSEEHLDADGYGTPKDAGEEFTFQLVPDRVSAARMALHQRQEMRRELKDPARAESYRNLCRVLCKGPQMCADCDTVSDSAQNWRRYMRRRLERRDTPWFLFTSGRLSFKKYRDLVVNSDVNILTTRGEGWGRPVQEAMALAVPSIVTNWSGPAAFSQKEFSFLIPIDEATQLREVPADLWFSGHKWAEPSVDDVRKLMIEADEMTLQDLHIMGARAREHVVRNLDSTIVAKQVLEVVAELAEKKEFLD